MNDKTLPGEKSGEKIIAGVIGTPIKHSRSPLMHNRWLKAHGIDGIYAPIEIAPGDLETRLAVLAAEAEGRQCHDPAQGGGLRAGR